MNKIITSAIVILFSLLFFSCNKSVEPNSPSSTNSSLNVSISKNVFADMIGNKNGITENNEIANLESYFNSNRQAWILGGFGGNSNNPDSLRANFHLFSNELYKSEQSFRQAFKGLSIKTPIVSISVLELNKDEIFVVQVFSAPGPNIYTGKFEDVTWRYLN